ncbi:hypothetical protein BHE74_00059856 [Ensete ventricosum]|nr:hypothetical protein BHE74_00059856 [Ensete ventricosum]
MATSGKLTGRLSRRGDFRYVVVYYRKPPSRLGTAAGGPTSRNDMPHVTVGVRRVFNVRLWERGTVSDRLYEELWRACAGPLVEIPRVDERVFYFPQGHLEQVKERRLLEVSTDQDLNQQIPQFNLPSKILCRVVNVHWDEASSIQKPEKISPWDVEPFSQPISASGDPQAAFSKKRARSPLDLPGNGSENEVIPFHFICSIFM